MTSGSIVSAIVDSSKNRKILLEVASQLGLNDFNVRTALRADEERLVALLVSALETKPIQNSILTLEDDSAQCFMDVVQDVLDKGCFSMAPEHGSKARRLIRKLSESCERLPSALFITGVSGREEHPTFGGGFGDIYQASYDNHVVALKHMRHFLRGAELRRIRLKFCREALLWKDLHHPHILPFIGIDRESFPASLCMVSPWLEHGTVLKYLNDHGRQNVDKLLFEIAQGLEYLHSQNIVHGDLRGSNILVNKDWSACLADFGLSGFSEGTTGQTSSKRAGSAYWMAPELLAPEHFETKFSRTPASDVYAFGCICFELYTGRPPFSELSEVGAMLKVVDGKRPQQPSDGTPVITDLLWHNISTYWVQKPTARPLAKVVVRNMAWPASEQETSTSSNLNGEAQGEADGGSMILFHVKALYDYEATIDEEFDFQAGDVIAVTATPDDGWWSGELIDENRRVSGKHIFPSNFVRLF
ncbi:kinase-like domain-containing protein [Mycena metata]|uniref:mitogen-activated protein kinase kinase kinase n=1 Tax=Mycena metata TaxID=1033252 RepID=A0AAD7NH79_9AGAR|nr:kinase-like domain-containing protein [Mycena metata]